jgi:hypothetical protein
VRLKEEKEHKEKYAQSVSKYAEVTMLLKQAEMRWTPAMALKKFS